MKVRDLFDVLKKTTFRSVFFNNPKDNFDQLELQEFTLEDFGYWQYGISNYGQESERFKFIIEFVDDDGEIATKIKFKNSLDHVLKDENILEMEVIEIKTLSLEGKFNISSTNTPWPMNLASMEIIVSKSK